MQRPQAWKGHVPRSHGGGDMHRCWKSVVGRLAHVAMIIRVNWVFGSNHPAHHFDCTVGDHLIGVHIRLRA